MIGLDPYAVTELQAALMEVTLRPGVDFALASCDEGSRGGGGWEQLARVRFNRFDLGRRAAQMMSAQLDQNGHDATSQLIRGEWMAGTTARPRLNRQNNFR